MSIKFWGIDHKLGMDPQHSVTFSSSRLFVKQVMLKVDGRAYQQRQLHQAPATISSKVQMRVGSINRTGKGGGWRSGGTQTVNRLVTSWLTWNGVTLCRRRPNSLEALLCKAQMLTVLRLGLSHSSMYNTCSQGVRMAFNLESSHMQQTLWL